MRNFLAIVFATILFLPLNTSSILAVQDIRIESPTIDGMKRSTYVENAVSHLRSQRDYATVIAARSAALSILEARKKNEVPDWQTIREQSLDIRNRYKRTANIAGPAQGKIFDESKISDLKNMVDMMGKVHGVRLEVLTPLIAPPVKLLDETTAPLMQFQARSMLSNTDRFARQIVESTVNEAWDIVYATNFPNQQAASREIFDVLLSETVNAQLGESAIDIAIANPDTIDPEIMRLSKIISKKSESPNAETRESIKDDILKSFAKISEQMNKKTIEKINGINEADREDLRRKIVDAEQEKDTERDLETFGASVSVLAKMAALIDPKHPEIAKGISVLGNASLQIATAIAKFSKLGTSLATLNIISALVDVVSFFISSGPTIDEQILKEVGELRTQVEEFRKQMHDRFDRVDMQLDRIYKTMLENFDLVLSRMDSGFNDVKENLEIISNVVSKIERDLGRLEPNLRNYFEAQAQMPLVEKVNRCVYHEESIFGGEVSFELFKECTSALITCAVDHSRNDIFSGNPSPAGLVRNSNDTADRDLAEAILANAESSLDRNVNFYAGIAGERFANSYVNQGGNETGNRKRFANPAIWSFCTGAYLRLVTSYPDHAARITDAGVRDLINTGADLRKLLSSYGAGQQVDFEKT